MDLYPYSCDTFTNNKNFSYLVNLYEVHRKKDTLRKFVSAGMTYECHYYRLEMILSGTRSVTMYEMYVKE